MPNLLYFLNKIESCGCYSLTIDDGMTQTSYSETSGCEPDEQCSCYVPYTAVVNSPSAATYFMPDMLTPDGAVTADGSIEITFNVSMPPSTCKFENDFSNYAQLPVLGIRRSNMYSGVSATFPYIYDSLNGGLQSPPFDNAEAILTFSASGVTTLLLDNIIAIPYDGYILGYNYSIYLLDYGNCVAHIQVHGIIPYVLAYADAGAGACAPPGGPGGVITFEYRVINNSLTAIAAGTDFNISLSSNDFTLPGTLDYVLEDVDYTITNPNSANVEIIIAEDWLPGEVLAFNYLVDDATCGTTGTLTCEFTQLDTDTFTPFPLVLNITIL